MNTWDASAKAGEEGERAASLLRRVGSNRPIYKPQYWQTVKEFDQNANEEDPSNNCMPAGIPRAGIPSYIGQTPNYFIFIYPGQGGLIATQTMYRMIPADGRKHTPLEDLDGTYTGEAIAHWERYIQLASPLQSEKDWVDVARQHLRKLKGQIKE